MEASAGFEGVGVHPQHINIVTLQRRSNIMHSAYKSTAGSGSSKAGLAASGQRESVRGSSSASQSPSQSIDVSLLRVYA